MQFRKGSPNTDLELNSKYLKVTERVTKWFCRPIGDYWYQIVIKFEDRSFTKLGMNLTSSFDIQGVVPRIFHV